MRVRQDVLGLAALRRWLSHLVLFVFVARALIPIGYMPDFAAASKGVYRIVICTGGGTQSVDLDTNGQKLPAKPGSSHHQPCAFSATAAATNVPAVALAFSPSVEAAVIARANTFADLPPARAGPALGARAPPKIS